MVKLNIKNLERLLQISEEKYISLITFNANDNLKKFQQKVKICM